MNDITSFGAWLRRRRKALDLTQTELANRAGCVQGTIKSIEADARRPSRQLAERLADVLELEADERVAFLKAARAELSPDQLASPTNLVARAAGSAAALPPPYADQRVLPTGTVTFLFTDIEGSTQLWEQYPQAMQAARTRHDAILTEVITAHGGVVVKSSGDGILAVFARATNALAGALAAQLALQSADWGTVGPLRVRMALHTAVAELRNGDYFGPPLNRVARLLNAGHGGQILLSRATAELVNDHLPSDVELRDLGAHRLKDLTRPEHIFQLVAPHLPADFPALRTLDARPNHLPAQPTAPIGRQREERRWATVLFADLAISEQVDPEDLKDLVFRRIEQIGEQIRRFGGTVINIMGDTLLAAFGAPTAHEDDPTRAVRAALAMRDSALFDDAPHELKLHIGINTGEVLATVQGPQERREYTVLGDTVNTANRILKVAPSGSVLVGEETYRATRHVVQYRELSLVVAKGNERPVRVWEALTVAPVPEARPLGSAPLVGRDQELGLLQTLWERVVREAQPRLVLILGEPGIGKSRLCAEFEHTLPDEALVIHGRCLPYGEALGYGALAMALKEAAGITADDHPQMARTKLADLVAHAFGSEETDADPSEVARHLALLSGLDVEADRAANIADQRTLHTSARQFLEALARRQPLCVSFEDIHWADDALLDLIEFASARAHDAALLILTQARWDLLEQRPAWGRNVRELVSLRLEGLDQRRRHDLILALCHKHGLSERVAEQVAQPAGGNPLFIEELVAMIAERGELGAGGIPSVIKALLAARVDALPLEERSTIQLAAVFGKIFWLGGVRALDGISDVSERLEVLEHKDLLRSKSRSQIRGEQEYTFKHELIRDVAYEMLPRSERRSLHGKVVDWLEQAMRERVEEAFDLLAYHAVQADQQERALDYLVRAAERARRAAARQQEAALLAQAIDIAERLDQGHMVASLHAQRGKALADVGMWAAARPELEAALAGLGPEFSTQRIQVLTDLAIVCHWVLDVPSTRRCATEALALAEEADRDDLAAGAIGALAWADSSDGALHNSLEGFERAFARAGEIRTAQLAPSVELSGLILYWLGHSDEAIERSREALQIGRVVSDTSTTIRALGNLGLALTGSGRYDEALQVFDEARRFGREYGVGTGLARAIAMCGGLHLEVFDFAGAEALAEEARELARSLNWTLPVISCGIDLLFNFARCQEVGRAEQLMAEVAEGVRMGAGAHGWLWKLRFAQARAELALARGDWEAALRWADDAITQSRLHGRVKYQVAGVTARGRALDALGRTREAIADLRSAVDLARPVGDPAMFLRAATGLLALDGNDVLATDARTAADSIALALPDAEMRRRFAEAEPVRLLDHLG
jgi:class 3 adenylate cyclase/tetratricopeptide (TPR) repeat protein